MLIDEEKKQFWPQIACDVSRALRADSLGSEALEHWLWTRLPREPE